MHRAATCASGNGDDHPHLPKTGTGLLCTTPPITGADLTEGLFWYNKELLSVRIFSGYLVDSCWKNNLGINIMDQDEKPLDMESEHLHIS